MIWAQRIAASSAIIWEFVDGGLAPAMSAWLPIVIWAATLTGAAMFAVLRAASWVEFVAVAVAAKPMISSAAATRARWSAMISFATVMPCVGLFGMASG